MTASTQIYRGVADVPTSPPSPPRSDAQDSSTAMTVVTAVEKSLLRTLAFVLYQLDHNRAKYCASSILQWYLLLQTQLPVGAVNSLEKVADSVVSLSDARFADFWRSLVEKDLEEVHFKRTCHLHRHTQSSTSACEDDSGDDEQQHVIKRLYHHVFVTVQRFFAAEPPMKDKGRIQTPCTSPVDPMDLSQRRNSVRHHHPHAEYYIDSCYDDGHSGSEGEEDDSFEPGWAVEYMEQESHIPSEMTRRMAKMMHSNVSLNLFRATVTFSGSDDDMDCLVGTISPESFPPTPITRDLQARRMNHYTVSVLDHATLTLRLLEEESDDN